jgi:BirA family transcriptional regulator, biotin operon repressor / biotin---[acetyl-CoA-carboxylase] ligase
MAHAALADLAADLPAGLQMPAAAAQAGASPMHWGAEALWQRLLPLVPGLTVEVRAQCDSTNTQLLDSARRSGAEMSPCLLVAEQQHQGRGRLGRAWQSAAGASLTFSLAMPLAPQDWSGLSLAVGLALAQALEPMPQAASPRLMLKWPNDLWLRDAAGPVLGRKLGGILIETVSVGSQRWCVVGVGLNVLPLPVPLPPAAQDLRSGYACLQELDADSTDSLAMTTPAVLARVAEPLVRELLRFEREGFAPLVLPYAARDFLRGLSVQTGGGEGAPQQTGVAHDIDHTGALRIRQAQGLLRVVSGEVGLRLTAPGKN